MTKITREEVVKIAQISRIALSDDEITPLIHELEQVLTYAERVTQIAGDTTTHSHKNVNLFREDVVVRVDVEPILAQAPERIDNYFVVPMIIEHN